MSGKRTKMARVNSWWLLAAFLVGALLVFGFFPRTVTEVQTRTVTVTQTKEVPVEVEVPVADAQAYLTDAYKLFWASAEEGEDPAGNDLSVLECGGSEYDFDEVSLVRLSDSWSLTYLDEDKYRVDFEVRLKYKESGEPSCRQSWSVSVLYEEGEDTVVTAEAL